MVVIPHYLINGNNNDTTILTCNTFGWNLLFNTSEFEVYVHHENFTTIATVIDKLKVNIANTSYEFTAENLNTTQVNTSFLLYNDMNLAILLPIESPTIYCFSNL